MAEVIRPTVESVLELVSTVVVELVANEKHEGWIKWILASVNKYFLDTKGGLPMYLEGDERTLQDEAEFYELRVDGPFILQPHNDLYYLDIEINVLVQSHMDDQDLYKINTAVGSIVRAFKNAICVYKYGDGVHDDQTFLGVLRLQQDLNESIDVNRFGIIKEDTRILQTTIEGHYRMEISNNGSN